MRRSLIWAAAGLALVATTGVAMVVAEPSTAPAFIAGDKPVTEDQVRQKLQSDGWSNVQLIHDGAWIEAIGINNGHTNRVVVNAQTGRLRADDDGDED